MQFDQSTSRKINMSSTIWFKTIKDYRGALAGKPLAQGQTVNNVENNYGIEGNPTQQQFQKEIAALENARYSYLYPSGISAICMVFDALLTPGNHILVPEGVYGPTRLFCDEILAKRNISTSYYDQGNTSSLNGQITDKTRLILIESPASVTFELTDIAKVKELAKTKNIITVADATWSSGILGKLLNHDIDVSVLSATKYIAGHSDVFMGTVSTNRHSLARTIARHHMLHGIYVSPFDAMLESRGIESLEARVSKHEQNALKVHDFLETQNLVARIYRPDKNDEKFYKYFTGFNGMISIELKRKYDDNELEDFIAALRVYRLGESWGGTQSKVLLFQPEEFRNRTHPPEGTVLRFSIGLEQIDLQINDLKKAFNKIKD